MRKLLVALFVALLMAGWGEEAQKKQVQDEAKDAAESAVGCSR